MDEPSPELKAALAQVHAPWDPERTQRTLAGLPRRAAVRRRRALLVRASAATLTLGVLAWLAPWPARQLAPAPLAAASISTPTAPFAEGGGALQAQQLQLPDGSTVQLLDATTDVAVEHSAPERIALHVRAGRARLEVDAREGRVFRLRTAQVVFEVLGAVLEVAQQPEGTWLRVETGRVFVVSGADRSTLVAGEEATFAARAPQPSSHAEPERRSARSRPASAALGPGEGWRDHAERGEFKQAFSLLPRSGGVETMDVSELLLAADAARLSGHPQAAVPFLERVVMLHAEDARAPLAAFTLGGVLMNQLGRPREAEAAYARARATSAGGALAQDALARQVEAAYRAGDEALARRLAREYLEHYPQGRRVHAVRRFGGM